MHNEFAMQQGRFYPDSERAKDGGRHVGQFIGMARKKIAKKGVYIFFLKFKRAHF